LGSIFDLLIEIIGDIRKGIGFGIECQSVEGIDLCLKTEKAEWNILGFKSLGRRKKAATFYEILSTILALV